MNKDDLIKKLEHIDLPEIEFQSHRRRLKVALLSSGYFEKQKEGSTMSMFKKFAPVWAIAIVAVIALLVVVSANKSTPAYAKEIAQKSLQTVSRLSTEQKLELGVLGNAESLLKEAQNAKDLTVLTYSQVESMLPGGSDESEVITDCPEEGLVETPEGSPEKGLVTCGKNLEEGLARLKQAKFLQYTRSGGEKVLLGIDQNNVAFFASVSFSK